MSLRRIVLALSVLASAVHVHAQSAAAPNTLTAAEKSAGWTLPKVLAARPMEVSAGDRRLRLAVRVPATAEKAR